MESQPSTREEVNGLTHSQNPLNTSTQRTSETQILTGQNPHRYIKTGKWGCIQTHIWGALQEDQPSSHPMPSPITEA